jgi:hypothetical protein
MSSFWLDSANTRYTLGRAFQYNDRQYTKAGASRETFEALGFTEVTIDPRPDDRFYIVSGPDNTGAYNSSPRDLDELKASFILQENQTARQILSNTDWYVIRMLEGEAMGTPTPMPAGLSDQRTSVRALSNARVADIQAATTLEELQYVLETPVDYPEFS